MTYTDAKLGTTVELVSGGPLMTVNERYAGNMVDCVWFVNSEFHKATFAPEALKAREPEVKKKGISSLPV